MEDEGFIDRRSLLKKGALIGGAVVWSAPVIQSLTSPVLAATVGTPLEPPPTTTPTPTPTPEGDGAPSWVIVWTETLDANNQPVYRAIKFNQDGSTSTDIKLSDPTTNTDTNGAWNERTKSFGKTSGAQGISGVVDNGYLKVTVPAGTRIVAWFLHDGSCQNSAGNPDKYRWDGDSRNPAGVGPEITTTWSMSVETFAYFEKCAP